MNSVYHENDDSRLVAACLRGDVQAQRELVDLYSGLLRHVALKILGAADESHVEDVVQESLAAIFQHLARWRGGNLPAWIGSVTARRAIDYRRRLQRSGECVSHPLTEQLGELELDARSVHSAAMVDLLDAVRRQLSDRQRAIFDGMLAGRSRQEVADQLNVSQRTLYYELGVIEEVIQTN